MPELTHFRGDSSRSCSWPAGLIALEPVSLRGFAKKIEQSNRSLVCHELPRCVLRRLPCIRLPCGAVPTCRRSFEVRHQMPVTGSCESGGRLRRSASEGHWFLDSGNSRLPKCSWEGAKTSDWQIASSLVATQEKPKRKNVIFRTSDLE